MKEKLLDDQEIGNYLYECSDMAQPLRSIARKIDPEKMQILLTLSKLKSKSYGRADFFGWKCDLEIWELWDLWVEQQGLCAVTKMPLQWEPGSGSYKNPWKVSIDRINSNKGYVKGNIRLVTHWYNNAKNTWPDAVPLQALRHWAKNA